jgi:outer membrane protein assembly factor BamB
LDSKQGEEKKDEEGGGSLSVPENTDLNRILDKAMEFFARKKWEEGIGDLQKVMEGKALGVDDKFGRNDPFKVFFSEDERLYFPLARFCQSLLASLPREGLETFRLLVDPKVEERYLKAVEDLDEGELRRLFELYLPSSYGAVVGMMLADLLEAQGRLGESYLSRQRILESFPDPSRSVQVKIHVRQAHIAALMGNEEGRDLHLKALQSLDPAASVRVHGELVPLSRLGEHEAFALRGAFKEGDKELDSGFSAFDFVPLWEFRGKVSDPYGLGKANLRNRGGTVFFSGSRGTKVPDNKSYRAGLPLAFAKIGGRQVLLIKDHMRLVGLDEETGKLVLSWPKNPEEWKRSSYFRPVSRMQQQALSFRNPAKDFSQQRVTIRHTPRGQYFYFLGNFKVPMGRGRLGGNQYRNSLFCFDVIKEKQVWMVKTRLKNGKNVFFLAPPISIGNWLFAPIQVDREFSIAKLDPKDGEILDVAPVHSGGSELLLPPPVPLVSQGNVLYFLTNSGGIAAFRAPDLELLWFRRYETWSSVQPKPKVLNQTRRTFYGVQKVRQRKFFPTPPLVFGDFIVIAPTDSDVLLCLNRFSGQVEWQLPRFEPGFRKRSFQQILGPSDGRIYLAGTALQGIDVVTGKRLFEVPLNERLFGRGLALGGHVFIPQASGVQVFNGETGSHLGAFPLPPLEKGGEERTAPISLFGRDGLLFVSDEVGVMAYAVPEDFLVSSSSVFDSMNRMLLVGRKAEAFELGSKALHSGGLSSKQREVVLDLCRRIGREVALDFSRKGETQFALDQLKVTKTLLRKLGHKENPDLLLARIEILEKAGKVNEVRQLLEILSALPHVSSTFSVGGHQKKEKK